MRDITRTKIEDYARDQRQTLITLAVAEAGIEVGRQLMAEMIAGYSKARQEAQGTIEDVRPAPQREPGGLNEVGSVPG